MESWTENNQMIINTLNKIKEESLTRSGLFFDKVVEKTGLTGP